MMIAFLYFLFTPPLDRVFCIVSSVDGSAVPQEPCFPCGIMGDLEWLCNGLWVKLVEYYLWVAVVARSSPCFVVLGTTTRIDCTDRQSTK